MPSLRKLGRVDIDLDSLTRLLRLPDGHKVVRAFMANDSVEPQKLVVLIEGELMPPHHTGQVVQTVKIQFSDYAQFT